MQLIVEGKFDVVHVNDIWWVPQTLRAVKGCKREKVQVLAHVRQEIEPWKVKRYELHKVCLLYAVSDQIKKSLVKAGIEEGKICVLHSGVYVNASSDPSIGMEIRNQYGVTKGDHLLGTVANLYPRKGYEVMLDALCLLVKSHPNIHFFIIGKDIILDEDADIPALMIDTDGLLFKDRALAAPLDLGSTINIQFQLGEET